MMERNVGDREELLQIAVIVVVVAWIVAQALL